MAATAKTKKIKENPSTEQKFVETNGTSCNEEGLRKAPGSAITNTDELERFLHESQQDKKISEES